MSEAFDAIVIGAGAAGLMCALTAGQRGARVLLLEHLDKAGAKILISGGGRCNFTNLHCAPERFISANPHFHKSALDRYTQHDFIALVERHRIAYHEKTLGQLFCDGSARAIVAMLLDRMRGRPRRCAARPSRHRHFARRRLPRRDRQGRLHRRRAGARDRRALDPEDGRDRICLRHRAALRPARHRDPAGARAADRDARGARRRPKCCPAFRSTPSRPAARKAFARISCSPIAASPARRSCRSRPTGGRAGRSRSISLPAHDADSLPQRAQARAPEGRAEDRARRVVSRPPRAARWPASLPNGDDGEHPRPHACGASPRG